ncbi:carboxypeptidase regulatory-like domain-containing protein [Halostella sp. JP-L12]|uniref:carboxypeptidase-like regulatory domain-containing protein n=1 Tax=Halostella TaxID=1843185 RepID=UPI0013CF09E2|nr:MULTISPECIES: carboxypeptidase-like regulatory domain-containing protein [Halostella]NHN46565.1 carboxypeptidase regulatory-like domain-containing protein [Halostella sp. JP-L12]
MARNDTTEGAPVEVNRRAVLGAVGVGLAASPVVSREGLGSRRARRQSDDAVVFADDFEDGDFAWTDRGHPEFWEESDGRVHYTPTSSAGSTGDNYAYANETFDGESGLLEWPLAVEVEAYARDTSAGVGAMLVEGGAQDGLGNVVLGVQDSAHAGGGDSFRVWNSEGTVDVGTTRDNETWYTYRLVPDLEADRIDVYRNDEHFTVTEPRDDPIGNVSVVLSGGTCWGCGGPGRRQYESIRVWDVSGSGSGSGSDCAVDARVTAFEVQGGEYRAGDTVSAQVTVENTGDCDYEFFVGFGVIDENGTAYNNDGSTGHPLRVAQGETATTTVEWQVEEGAPTGSYDAGTAVWRETDPNQLETRLDRATRSEAFTVVSGSTGDADAVTGTVVNARDEPVSGATVRVFGYADQQLLGTASTDENGEYAFDWSADERDAYTGEYDTVVILVHGDLWFDSVRMNAGSFFDTSSEAGFTLGQELLRTPTVVQTADGFPLGEVTVWRWVDVGSAEQGVLNVEVTNTSRGGDVTNLNDAYDLSSGIFTCIVPEDGVGIDYGPSDSVSIGGSGLDASTVLAVQTADAGDLSPYHPENTGLPFHAAAAHYGVYRMLSTTGETKTGEEAVSQVVSTVPGLSTFAGAADTLEWVFGDPFERTGSLGESPDRIDPNQRDSVEGAWNSGNVRWEEASVYFSVPYELTGGEGVEFTVVADWRFGNALGFGEGSASFAESYDIAPL